MISSKEVFCSELPSPGSIFLSSSCRISNTSTAGIRFQFASEGHSLTLQTTYNEVGEENRDELFTKKKKRKEYKLLVDRLRQRPNKDNTEEKSSTNSTNTTCLAHSSLQLDENSSIQTFALLMSESNSSGIETHSSGGTAHGNRSGDANNKEGGNRGNSDGSSNEINIEKKQPSNGDNGIVQSSSKYSLMIKYHKFGQGVKGKEGYLIPTTTMTEQINLDFRPIKVHAAKMHSSSSPLTADQKVCDGSVAPLIVGVFVSGDDNRLHFYMSTIQELREKVCQQEASATEATSTPDYTPCFKQAHCFDEIDPSIVTCASNKNEYHSTVTEGSMDDNPLMFQTPIMAIDTCISEYDNGDTASSSSSSATTTISKNKVNRLAMSCYDGLVRILTFEIECTSDAIRIAELHYSTFIVDGPVTTLQFGMISNSLKEEEGMADNSFLVAGSLCGLAFLFHQIPIGHTSFDGPVIVVDGLYDADKEGYEDCVTAVHAIRYHNLTILAVGTQGCRLVLFQMKANTTTRKELDNHENLTAEIENQTQRMIHLSDERDKLTIAARDLRQKMLEYNAQDEHELRGDSDIVNDGGEADTKAEHVERLDAIKTELDNIEQLCSSRSSMIAQLQSSIDVLNGKLTEMSKDSKSARNMHRYEFLSEYKLPYPIQGICSAVCEQTGDLECYIATKQTIHIYRLLSLQMADAAADSLERKLLELASDV